MDSNLVPAAIFDLDGVVLNTVPSLYNIYTDILAGLGVSGSRDEFNRLSGRNLDEIVSFLAQQHALLGREDDIRNRFETRFSLLYTQIDLVAGITPVLKALKKQAVSICLASSSSRNNIDAALRRFNLNRFFDSIVSGDDVARGKPHPDIYKLAKERCKCSEHFVIEDSLNGIQAAQRAGLVTIFYNPGGVPNRQGASYNISDLSDIPRIILEDKAIIASRAERIEIRRDDRQHPISTREEQLADEIWGDALKEKPSLFNGDVASYCSHEMLPNGTLVVACSPSQYKYVFAQLRDRRLKLAPPIGVSAVVIDKTGKALLGKRSQHVSEYGGYYEFVPSGGITIQNMTGTLYLEQIKTELTEETGINPGKIRGMMPFSLIYDRIHGVFDICVKLVLDCVIDPTALVTKEYAAFVLMDYDSLEGFIRQEPVVPTSEAMFRAMMNEVDQAT